MSCLPIYASYIVYIANIFCAPRLAQLPQLLGPHVLREQLRERLRQVAPPPAWPTAQNAFEILYIL